jgi:hypothetical protein
VTISLSTLSPEALSKFTETSAQQLAEHRKVIADTLQIKEEQVIAAGEYQFVEKSLIIELAPEVDLAALKLDPKAVVCLIVPIIGSRSKTDDRLPSRLD